VVRGIQGLPVVVVEGAPSRSRIVKSHSEVELVPAGGGGGVRRIVGQHDGASAVVKRDNLKRGVKGESLAGTGDLGVGVVVVPAAPGEIGLDSLGTLGNHGADQDGAAEEKLPVVGEDVCVGRVLKKQGPDNSDTLHVGLVVQGVIKRKEGVADAQGDPGHLSHSRPEVRLLWDGTKGVVVPGKGVKGAELHPPGAELLSGILDEAADISPDVRNTKDLEVEHARDGIVEVDPLRVVVTGPMASVTTGARISRAAENKGTLLGQLLQGCGGGDGLGNPVDVVSIILKNILGVIGIHGGGLPVERGLNIGVVDLVVGVVWVKAFPPRDVLPLLLLSLGLKGKRVTAGGKVVTGAKVGNLVHVDPETVDGDHVQEVLDRLGPVSLGVGVKEVGEHGVIGPNHPDHGKVCLGALDKDISDEANLVVLVASEVLNTRIHDQDILLLLAVQVLNKLLHLGGGIVDRVKSPIHKAIHVASIKKK